MISISTWKYSYTKYVIYTIEAMHLLSWRVVIFGTCFLDMKISSEYLRFLVNLLVGKLAVHVGTISDMIFPLI